MLDSENLPEFDRDRFEGRIERPLSRVALLSCGGAVALIIVALLLRAGDLQLMRGVAYAKQAQDNQLNKSVLFADRGLITDRTGTPLAWNERQPQASTTEDFAERVYASYRGLAHAVGYVHLPAKDSSGFYYRDSFVGLDGAERAYDGMLAGLNGLKLVETDARGQTVSESVIQPPAPGQKVILALDSKVTQGLYDILAARAGEARAQGAAGVVMNVATGEILALTSYPEYNQNIMVSGDAAAIASYINDPRQPFLDRATDGLYAPGSIVKPIVAVAGLTEGVITQQTQITSTGSISVPNPYDPAHPSIFKDWRVNGVMTVRDAIAVSSDVFFYEVGGGYLGQPGLGIAKLDRYFTLFGFGSDPGLPGFEAASGGIPTPQWKVATFPQDPTWRIGDTYHTAIGQYGMQVSPLQAVREAAVIANGGTLLTPTLMASSTPRGQTLPIVDSVLQIVREGMRQGVTSGIASAVDFPFVAVAGKTGTAQVGLHNQYQNAWMIGFWPYDNPQWAYAVVLEKMPAGTTVGGSIVMSDFFNWLRQNAPQYLQ